jgi:hypothetical protein
MGSTAKRKSSRAGMSWEQIERANLAGLREEYQQTTPGQRVEELIRLCEFANEIAAAGARARSRAS